MGPDWDEVIRALDQMEVRLSRAIEEDLAAPIREILALVRAGDGIEERITRLERQMSDLALNRRGS